MATFTGAAGTANTFVGTAVADLFRFAAADINSRDSVTGGGGADRLQLTSAGLVASTALAGVKGVEQIALANGANAIKLADANFTGVTGGKIAVSGGSGNDRIDASTLTGANRIDVNAGAGLDVLRGGAGSDIFRFKAADLAGDTVVGGLGTDRLVLTTSGALAAGALAKLSGVEMIDLAAGGNALAFFNGNFTGTSASRISVTGSAGNDVLDGSAIGAGRSFVFTAGAGLDTLKGGAGADTFRFKATDLAGDTVRGGSGADTLQLTTAGVLAAGTLANLSDVEAIQLAEGGNTITLLNANLTGVSGARITVRGGAAGNDGVNASGLTGARSVDVTAGAGLDVLRGGAGNDIFRFKAAELAGDTVVGGLGTDRLVLTTSGALAAGALAKLSGVELIDLAAGGNTLSFINGNFTGASSSRISVTGSAGNDVADGSAVGAGRSFVFTPGAGLDTLKGGAGADMFRFKAADLAGDTVQGGGGYDRLYITTPGALAANALANVTGIDEINLASGGNSITLSTTTVGDDSTIFVISAGGTNIVNASAFGVSQGLTYIGAGGSSRVTGGAGDDQFFWTSGVHFGPNDTVDGGGGRNFIFFNQSMNFLGDTIRNIEQVVNNGRAAANVAISGENAARLLALGSSTPDGVSTVFTVRLTAGSITDLSKLVLANPDAADAINVVATSGVTSVTLSSSIASFTGSADADTVGLAPGGAYQSGAVINGGGGDDRIVHDFGAAIDGGTGNDTLVLLTQLNFVTQVRLMNANQVVGGSEIIANFENVDASGVTISGVELGGRDDVASVLIGSAQDDTITAGAAGAVITGGLGADILTGVDGAEDRFRISSTAEAAGDTINGAGGDDGIDLFGSADLSGAAISGIETLYLAANDGAGTFTNDNLTATLAAAQAESLIDVFGNGYFTDSVETLVVNAGESGVDLSRLNFYYWSGADQVRINGTSGYDSIIGTSQNDVIDGGGGDDLISGGDGDDVIAFYLTGEQALSGSAGNDTVRQGNTSLFDGVSYNLTVDLASGSISVDAPDIAFSNRISATFFENADLSANFQDTAMIGSDGANALIGGSGIDTITGGLGADTLTGGGGADRFVWNDKLEGGDTITDFVAGTDLLAFAASNFAVVGAFDSYAYSDQGNPVLDGVDLFICYDILDNAAQVRASVDRFTSNVAHGMFVVGLDSSNHSVLYYTANASSDPGSGGDRAFYEIADLGAPLNNLVTFLASFLFI